MGLSPIRGLFRRGFSTSGVPLGFGFLSGLVTTPVPGLSPLRGVPRGIVSSTGIVLSGISTGVRSPKIRPRRNLGSTGLSSDLSIAPGRGVLLPISLGRREMISDRSLLSGALNSGRTGSPSGAIEELILLETSSSPRLPGWVVRPNLSLSTITSPRFGICSRSRLGEGFRRS